MAVLARGIERSGVHNRLGHKAWWPLPWAAHRRSVLTGRSMPNRHRRPPFVRATHRANERDSEAGNQDRLEEIESALQNAVRFGVWQYSMGGGRDTLEFVSGDLDLHLRTKIPLYDPDHSPPASFRHWIKRVARNWVVNRLEGDGTLKRGKHLRFVEQSELEEVTGRPWEEAVGGVDLSAALEQRIIVQLVIRRLPKETRRVTELSFCEGWHTTDIAWSESLSESVVKDTVNTVRPTVIEACLAWQELQQNMWRR